MMDLPTTPEQTVGPYFSLGLMHEDSNILVQPDTQGERIGIEGYLFDGNGDPVFNVMLEIWQANAAGRYNHPLDQRPLPLDPAFIGFGRASTDANGHFSFETIMPGAVPYDDHTMQAPHIMFLVHTSGVAYPLQTRMYFGDDPGVADDPLLQRISEKRRHTLIARPQQRGEAKVYRFDIVLRGEAEELSLAGKEEAEDAVDAPSGAGKAETVFLALR